MIALIDDHRWEHGVEPICKVLPIAPSTCHDHMAKRAEPDRLSDRAKRDAELRPEIEQTHAENFCVYGVRKVWRQMRREGVDIVARTDGASMATMARCTVTGLMKEMRLEGVIRGKKIRTTIPGQGVTVSTGSRELTVSCPRT